jgi:hypothetical protein
MPNLDGSVAFSLLAGQVHQNNVDFYFRGSIWNSGTGNNIDNTNDHWKAKFNYISTGNNTLPEALKPYNADADSNLTLWTYYIPPDIYTNRANNIYQFYLVYAHGQDDDLFRAGNVYSEYAMSGNGASKGQASVTYYGFSGKVNGNTIDLGPLFAEYNYLSVFQNQYNYIYNLGNGDTYTEPHDPKTGNFSVAMQVEAVQATRAAVLDRFGADITDNQIDEWNEFEFDH